MADEAIKVKLLREPRDKNVSAVSLKLSLTNHHGMNFQSVTNYKVSSDANAEAILDLDRDLPTADKYGLCEKLTEDGPLPMYPLWSLKAQTDSIRRYVNNDARQHFHCQFSVSTY